jgi:hypothetical protein
MAVVTEAHGEPEPLAFVAEFDLSALDASIWPGPVSGTPLRRYLTGGTLPGLGAVRSTGPDERRASTQWRLRAELGPSSTP